MIKLSNRLAAIASCIQPGERVADIGTDHGFLPIYLQQSGISPHCILCDMNEGPLRKAKEHIETLAPDGSFELRLGDGLQPIQAGECDAAVIAGMGGKLIAAILERNPDVADSMHRLVLQPRNAQDKLRHWLKVHAFEITDELLAEEGRYVSEILVVQKKKAGDSVSEKTELPLYPELSEEISPLWFEKKEPLLPILLQQKLKIETDILREIYRGGGAEERMAAVRNRSDKLRMLLKAASEIQIGDAGERILKRKLRRAAWIQEKEEIKTGMKNSEFLTELRIIAPMDLEEEWDNSGRQIEMGHTEVERVLIALEITNAVIDEALELGVDYIVTHHPLIFHPVDLIDATTTTGNYIIRLIQNGISVYSAHTNFDSVFGGNNDYLAELLGLSQVRRMKILSAYGCIEKTGRLGVFDRPCTLKEAAEMTARVLGEKVKYVGDPETEIRSVAICTGAGGDSLEGALRNRCDLYITGDIRYHEAQMAKEQGLCMIDAGHYGTEKIFVENFAEKLRKAVGDQIEIYESRVNINPFDHD